MNSTYTDLDITNLTISKFHTALSNGTTTCTALVTSYLNRIAHYDSTLKSIIHIIDKPTLLQIANQKDLETHHLLQHNLPFTPLHGIPIILKDNITTHDTPTSAGVQALHALVTKTDSDVVSRLRSAGAIILAKANLHEFALQGTTTSSVRGQTVNPFDGTRTPGGSSGGTAVAVAAGFGLVGCGSDTVNSLRSPASACGIVGFRPSTGRVCMQGIVPVCEAQDVVGPMGRSVEDVRVVFDVMKIRKREEAADMKQAMEEDKPRKIEEDANAKPIRIGILDAYFQLDDPEKDLSEDLIQENAIVQRIMHQALSSIEAKAGPGSGSDLTIQLIHINPASHPDWRFTTLQTNCDTQLYEFQERLDSFLQSPSVLSPYPSLKAIAESGQYHRNAVTEVFAAPLKDPQTFSLASAGYQARLENISALKESVGRLFDSYRIDALVYPHQRQLVAKIGTTIQPRRNGILAALTGRPAICIPARFTPPTASASQGVPVGLEMMGRVNCDEELLALAERIEGILQQGKAPDLDWIKMMLSGKALKGMVPSN